MKFQSRSGSFNQVSVLVSKVTVSSTSLIDKVLPFPTFNKAIVILPHEAKPLLELFFHQLCCD